MFNCSLPWNGFSNDPDGKVRPCCIYREHILDDQGNPFYVQTHSVKEIFHSNYMKNLRNQFRNGEKPKGCETCVKDEENGYKSKRQIYTQGELGRNTNFNEEPDFPIEYQMILSNACNLKCRSCTPSHSNLWQSEYKTLWGNTGYEMPYGQPSDNDSVLWKDRNEWMPKLKRLEVVGGEPFYIKKWQILWNELIQEGLSKDITVDMSTNATIYGGDVLKLLSNNFKSVGVGLSIDGMDDLYNYLRHPGNWDTTKENLKKYHELSGIGFSITHTIGWLNAYMLPEFHEWCNINLPKFRIWNNIIHYPRHMSIITIPKNVKDMIRDKWNNYNWGKYKNDIDGIINFMYNEQPSDTDIQTLYQAFNVHDSIRNEKLVDVIPNDIKKFILPYLKDIK